MAESVQPGGDDRGSAQCDDEHECKICYNRFDLELRAPKLLDCSHAFCRECLEALHSRDGGGWRIGCPVCRHRTPVPEYQVQKLPDDTELTEAIRRQTVLTPAASSDTEVQAGPAGPAGPGPVPPVGSQQGDGSCRTCGEVAFACGCVCAIFSLLSTVLFLLLGLILVHNFRSAAPHSGPVCLFIASVLALFSLILTWLLCMLRSDLDLKPAASVPSLI